MRGCPGLALIGGDSGQESWTMPMLRGIRHWEPAHCPGGFASLCEERTVSRAAKAAPLPGWASWGSLRGCMFRLEGTSQRRGPWG